MTRYLQGSLIFAALALSHASCWSQPRADVCSADVVCPPGTRCAPDGQTCVSSSCGNGIVEPGTDELCDQDQFLRSEDRHCTSHGYDMGRVTCSQSCGALDLGGCFSFNWHEARVVRDPQLDDIELESLNLTDVWGTPDGELVASGFLHEDRSGQPWLSGVLLRYHEEVRSWHTWSRSSNDVAALAGVWVAPDGVVHAVGWHGYIVQCTVDDWSCIETVIDPVELYFDVWGTDAESLYAVGMHAETGASVIRRLENGQWVLLPDIPGTGEQEAVTGVWGTGPDNVYFSRWKGSILRHNGLAWTSWSLEEPRDLHGIWGVDDSGEVFAVGTRDTLMRYDPAADRWVSMTSRIGRSGIHFRGISGTSAHDIYAVGDDRTIAHFDGHAWSEQRATDQLLHSGHYEFHAVWAQDRQRLAAVGRGELAVSGDTDERLAVLSSGSDHGIVAIWPDGDGQWLAVDNSGNRLIFADGWQILTAGTHVVHGAWRGPDGKLFFVGPDRFLAWSRDTSSDLQTIEVTAGHADSVLHAVWGRSSEDVFAVGDNGLLLHYDGSRLHSFPATSKRLTAVSGTTLGSVFVVGEAGTVLRYDRTDWSELHLEDYEPAVQEMDLAGVWAVGDDEFFAVGNGGIVHYNGDSADRLVHVEDTAGRDLTTIWGLCPGRMFAVGRRGAILYHDGVAWTEVATRTVGEPQNALYGIGGQDDSIWFTGDGGMAMRLESSRVRCD